MTCGPKNTTHRAPWPFFWAPPGFPPRPVTGSCRTSSPSHDLAIRSLSSHGATILTALKGAGTLHPSEWQGSRPGDGAEPGRAHPPLLAGGVPPEGTSALIPNLPVPSPGALGLCQCRQWDWWARSRGKESLHCPVEMAEFPKVGQVNFLTRADLLVTMDIAQLYTNNPP